MAMEQHSLRLRAASLALAAGLGLLVAACGSTAVSPGYLGPPASSGQPASRPAAQPAAKATLQVVESEPGGQARRWSLRCDPAGGTMPDAAAACQLLIADTTILHPVRSTAIRCETLAGTRTFTITGSWYGKKLHEIVAERGCDARLWSRLAMIFR